MDPTALVERRILVVDDEPQNVKVLSRMLARAGYERVRGLTDPREVLPTLGTFEPDLLLLDLRMPHLDGFDILALLSDEVPSDQYLPVLVLTGDLSAAVKERALLAGARDFITKPFDMTEVLLRIRNLLETRTLHLSLRAHNETLEDRVRERTRELAHAQIEILHRLALAAEFRDDITGRHAERVGVLSALLAREIGCPEEEVRLIRRAATLHDVGKIGVPDAILMKPASLSQDEFALMKNHTQIGSQILSGSRFPLLRMAREIALFHHEKWDGSGYAAGASGEEIPLVGRIVAVADVFDSLTHERPYKAPSPPEEALKFVLEARGTHFDPRVVDALQVLWDRGELADLDATVEALLEGEKLADDPLFPVSEGMAE